MADKAEFVCECTHSDTLDRWYASNIDQRERIVRCRECKHGDPFCECSSYPGKINCLHFAQWDYYDDEPGVFVMEPSDFCSYGVMRDGEME